MRGSKEEGVFFSGEPSAGVGRFRVQWTHERVHAEISGGVQIDTVYGFDPPSFGRLAVQLEPGVALESLEITGRLNPIWLASRVAFLEATKEKNKTSPQRGR